jgi:hypothetical protein
MARAPRARLACDARRAPLLQLLEVLDHKQNLHLVMECLEGDLEGLIRDRRLELGPGMVKALMRQLLQVRRAGQACLGRAGQLGRRR